MDKDLLALDRLLKALADPTRLRILTLLQGGDVCVCHIQESLRIPQPKTSRHLAYLRKAGLVVAERRGLWVHYRAAPQVNPVLETLLETARHCATHAAATKRDAARLEKAVGCCPDIADAPGLACCSVKA